MLRYIIKGFIVLDSSFSLDYYFLFYFIEIINSLIIFIIISIL
jgi:hypothetical protein